MGDNINGPSLIRVPDWVPSRLGRFYLYFAHHRGTYIRLAYADHLCGPWNTHEPGALDLSRTPFIDHIASPDVHVDAESRQIRMYYHGLVTPDGKQSSAVAVSGDGIAFTTATSFIGEPYFRVFRTDRYWYAVGMPGQFYRSRTGLADFEVGPRLFTNRMRHTAVSRQGNTLHVFYSNIGDTPERIVRSTIDLTPDWAMWRAGRQTEVLRPEREWEGARLPAEPSLRGLVTRRVRQLRDPAIFEEGTSVYLLYCVAGESGIAIARIAFDAAE